MNFTGWKVYNDQGTNKPKYYHNAETLSDRSAGLEAPGQLVASATCAATLASHALSQLAMVAAALR